MKKVDINSVIGNTDFWLYFISTAFPNALDEEEDISLSDFMYENYDLDAGDDWVNDFVQFSPEAMDNDGYIDDPNTLELSAGGNSFRIEFHPGATLFIFNDKEIGEASGEYKIRTLSREDFRAMISGCTDPRIPLLLLPVLALEEADIPETEKVITAGLSLLELKKEHINKISGMIISGLL